MFWSQLVVLSLVCHKAVSPWRLVVQHHNLYSDTAILNEVGETRHFGTAMGPSTVALQGSRICRDMRSNCVARSWLSEEIMVHLDKAWSDQALPSKILRKIRTGEAGLPKEEL